MIVSEPIDLDRLNSIFKNWKNVFIPILKILILNEKTILCLKH